LARELDRLEREGTRLGLHLGRRLSRRLVASNPREEDVNLAFGFLWDEISRDYAREAVNVRSFETDIDPAHLFDRLWALGAPDLVKEAISRSLRARIEAALAGQRALSSQELGFIFHNLWARLGAHYIAGAVCGLGPGGAHHSLVKQLCADAWHRGELTHEIAGRAWLYAAVALVAGSLGRAAKTALASEDSRRARAQEIGTKPAGLPSKEPEGTASFWKQVQALLDQQGEGHGFWASLDRTLAQGYDMTFEEKTR
jgi:hypothetical protein